MGVTEEVTEGAVKAMAKSALRGLLIAALGVLIMVIPMTPWLRGVSHEGSGLFPWAGFLFVAVGLAVLGYDIHKEKDPERRRIEELERTVEDLKKRLEQLLSSQEVVRAEGWREGVKEQRDIDDRRHEAVISYRRAQKAAMHIDSPPGETIQSLLDAVVAICETKPLDERDYRKGGFSDKGSFWVKIYTVSEDTDELVPYSASSCAPNGVMQYRLKKGIGAAGQHLAALGGARKTDTDKPIFYTEDQIYSGISEVDKYHLESAEIRSLLCAAIYEREIGPHGNGELFPKKSPAVLAGLLCFCSKLEADKTSLRQKEDDCRQAAQIVGAVLSKHQVPRTLPTEKSVNIPRNIPTTPLEGTQ